MLVSSDRASETVPKGGTHEAVGSGFRSRVARPGHLVDDGWGGDRCGAETARTADSGGLARAGDAGAKDPVRHPRAEHDADDLRASSDVRWDRPTRSGPGHFLDVRRQECPGTQTAAERQVP